MSNVLSESNIVRAFAHESARRIARKVIAVFQGIEFSLSGETSGLKSAWDEICVQVQLQESVWWEFYDREVYASVDGYVTKLPKHEREAIWLQTPEGTDWCHSISEDREAYPAILNDDIVHYVIQRYVYAEADEWSNARIRAYIDRHSGLDLG